MAREGGCEAAAMTTGRSWNVQPDCWGERQSWGFEAERGAPRCLSQPSGEHTPSEAPEGYSVQQLVWVLR